MESRPFFSRVPDDSLLVPAPVTTNLVPGAGLRRFAATRASDGAYAFVSVPCGHPFEVRLEALGGRTIRAWWFDPRTGEARPADEFPKAERRRFVPPTPGELVDWVLVLDDAARGFPPPGRRPRG